MSETKPIAMVNGERVRAAPRPRPNRTRYNPDISWLVNDSRGELGEKGMVISLDSGGGGNPADTWPLHEKLLKCGSAVVKWRRLWAIWVSLDDHSRRVLTSRYRSEERQHSEIRGLRATFGDLATLAWDMSEDQVTLARVLSNPTGIQSKATKPTTEERRAAKRAAAAVVNGLRRLVERENLMAHRAWLDREALTQAHTPARKRHV